MHPFIREETIGDEDEDVIDHDHALGVEGDDEDSNLMENNNNTNNSEKRKKRSSKCIKNDHSRDDNNNYFDLKQQQQIFSKQNVIDKTTIPDQPKENHKSKNIWMTGSLITRNNDPNSDVDLTNKQQIEKKLKCEKQQQKQQQQLQCLCYDRYRSDSTDGENHLHDNNKPKKCVRFAERIYETVYIASRLYDRRSMAKYHSSTRHHPPMNGKNEHKKISKSTSKNINNNSTTTKSETTQTSSLSNNSVSLSSVDNSNGCRLTKSQRAKQSKKDKKKMRFMRKDDTYSIGNYSSDDQGYGSSVINFSD